MRFTLKAILGTILMCAALASAQSTPNKTNAELLKADRDFLAATQARKADGWMEFMTEETTISREKPYSGIAAIRATVADDYKDPNFQLTWDPETAVLMESGKMGYTSGHFIAVVTGPDKKPAKFGGQYLTVWQKQ